MPGPIFDVSFNFCPFKDLGIGVKKFLKMANVSTMVFEELQL